MDACWRMRVIGIGTYRMRVIFEPPRLGTYGPEGAEGRGWFDRDPGQRLAIPLAPTSRGGTTTPRGCDRLRRDRSDDHCCWASNAASSFFGARRRHDSITSSRSSDFVTLASTTRTIR